MIEHAGACSINSSMQENIIFKKGEGGYVYDENGNKYYDFVLGFGPVLIGHADMEFNEAVVQYMNTGIHFPSYSIYHEKYANMICKEDESVCYFKTSSETITAAIRLATKVSSKKGIIRCGFIGWHDAQIANSISWHEPLTSPLRNAVKYKDGFRGCSGNESITNWSDLKISTLESVLENNDIGMIIIDAYQLHLSSYNVIKDAIRLCKENGVVVIWDETKTAGRVSLRGVSDLFDFDYDMLILGKAIANGAPLSLLVGKSDLLKYAKDVRITGTFSKEVLSVYCALATKKIIENKGGYPKLCKIGEQIVKTFNEAIEEAGVTELINCESVFGGSMFELNFSDAIIGNTLSRNRLKEILVDNRIILLLGHPSFVCYEHGNIDYVKLKKSIVNTLVTWKNGIE